MQSLTVQFKAFVKTRPADEKYEYYAARGCALHSFLASFGYPVNGVGGTYWRDQNLAKHPLPPSLQDALEAKPHTFGALANRLEKMACRDRDRSAEGGQTAKRAGP